MTVQKQRKDNDLANNLSRFLLDRTAYKQGKTTISNQDLWDFSANDYLGLSHDKTLLENLAQQIKELGMGSTGSRLLSGQNEVAVQLESNIAKWLGKESALLFNSGYQCNVGVIPTFYGKDDLIITDKLIHASLIDGIKLSGATLKRFNHLNYDHCEQLLKENASKYKNILLVTESIFSMDGDVADIKKLVELKQHYHCNLLVDEAHAIGICGDKGTGLAADNIKDIDFLIGTFGKAFASSGAYVALTKQKKALLINQCRSFIYTTALPLPVIFWNVIALEQIKKADPLRVKLTSLQTHFREELIKLNLNVIGQSHIVPVIGESITWLEKTKEDLKKNGIFVPLIKHPTVPKGQERFRFSISTDHSKEVLDDIINIFKNNC